MSLKDFLNVKNATARKQDEEVTKERIVNNLSEYQKMIAYWRQYPDKFIDYLCSLNPDNTFHFFFYQRLY